MNLPRVRAQDTDAVLRALKEGRSFVTNGPLLSFSVHGLGPGDTLRLSPHEREIDLTVTAEASPYMALDEVVIWADRQIVARAPLAARTGERAHRLTLRVRPAQAHALLATVSGRGSLRALLGGTDAAPFAFTNPLWIAPP